MTAVAFTGFLCGCGSPAPAPDPTGPSSDVSADALAAFDAAVADPATGTARRIELGLAAAKALRERIEAGDADPARAAALCRVTRLSGQPAAALKHAERGLAAHPSDPGLARERVWCLLDLLGTEEALATHEGRTERQSALPLRAATRRACQDLAAIPGMKSLGDGCAALADKDGKEAIRNLSEAVGAGERDPDLLIVLAAACLGSEDPGKAAALLDEVLKIDAGRLDALTRRSSARERLGDDSGSDADADRALALWPEHVHAIDAKAGRMTDSRNAASLRDFAARVEAFRPKSAGAFALRTLAFVIEEKPSEATKEADGAVLAWPGTPVPLVMRAFARMAARDAKGAMEDAQAALALAPGEPHLEWLVARMETGRGKTKDAEKHLAAGLKTDPFDSGCLSLRGEIRLQSGRAKEAIEDLELAVRIRPSLADAWKTLAQAREAAKDSAGAGEAWKQAVTRKPDDAEIRGAYADWLASRGDKAAAIAELDAAVKAAKPADALEFLRRRATFKESLKDFAGARADLDEVVAKYPKESLGWNQRANLRAGQGDREGALEDYARAIDLAPDDAVIRCNRAISLRELGRTKEAKADLDVAARGEGVTPGVLLQRSALLQSLGDRDGALKDANRALELNASSVEALVQRGSLKHDGNDLKGALADLDRAVKLSPDSGSARNLRGIVKASLGDYEGALEDYEVAIRMLPDSPMPQANRGHALASLGKFESAIEAFDASLLISPASHDIFNSRGIARFRLKNYRAAAADFKAAADLSPSHGQYWRNLAEAERSGGDKVAGYAAIDRAIRATPDNGSWRLDKAVWLDADGSADEALSEANLAVGLMKGRFEPLNFRGILRQKAEDLRGALEDFGRAAALAPDNGQVLSNLALLRLRTGDPAGAVTAANESVRRAPGSGNVVVVRLQCYAAAGRSAEIPKDIEKLADKWPKSSSLAAIRSDLRMQLGDAKGAAADLDRAAGLDPDDPFVKLARCRARVASGESAQSVADLSAFLKHFPSAPAALRLRAESLRAAGQPREALADMEKVVELLPDNAGVLAERGEAYLDAGELKAARADFERAIELDPGSTAAIALRAVARHGQGEKQEAIADLEGALRKAPSGWSRRAYFQRLLTLWREEK